MEKVQTSSFIGNVVASICTTGKSYPDRRYDMVVNRCNEQNGINGKNRVGFYPIVTHNIPPTTR